MQFTVGKVVIGFVLQILFEFIFYEHAFIEEFDMKFFF